MICDAFGIEIIEIIKYERQILPISCNPKQISLYGLRVDNVWFMYNVCSDGDVKRERSASIIEYIIALIWLPNQCIISVTSLKLAFGIAI